MKTRLSLTCLALFLLASGTAAAAVREVPAAYPTIQAAIDAAAPGDVVNVAAGIYEEALNIDKNVTVTGAGLDLTVVRCPVKIRNLFALWKKPLVFVHDTPAATVQDLTVDGYLRAQPDSSLIGVAFWNAGGTLRRCLLRDLRQAVPGYAQTGVGVYAYNNLSGVSLSLAIQSVRIKGYQKAGIALYGEGLAAVIDDVEVDGSDLATPAIQNGIEVGLSASAVISNARVTGNQTSVLPYTACGVLPYFAASVDVRDSRIEGNETSFYYIGTSGRLDRCRAEGVDTPRAGSGLAVINSTGFPRAPAGGAGSPTFGAVRPYAPEGAVPPPDKAAKTLTIDDCDFIGHLRAGTAGLAALSQAGTQYLTVSNSLFTGWDYGMDVSDGASQVFADCRHNQFAGNASYGVMASTITPVDARLSFWGAGSGPYHPVRNPGGTGSVVGDQVLFQPWTGDAGITVVASPAGPIRCDQTAAVAYGYAPHAAAPDLRGYDVTIHVTDPLTVARADFIDLNPFAGIGTRLFRVTQVDASTWTVSCALLGGSVGLAQAADLFRVIVHPTAGGTGTVSASGLKLRALDNGEISASTPAVVSITADCTAPGPVSALAAAPHHDRITVTWVSPPADVDSLEVWRGLWHDGAHASAYPEYDDLPGNVIPSRLANRAAAAASADWYRAATVPAGTVLYQDTGMGATRGVYYYEVFAKDAAANWSPPAAANARATSYWLGDVPPYVDGLCGVADVSKLGACYGTTTGDPNYDATVDVGPTDDFSRFGIPLTDSGINFEDLMVFAMNFSLVSPTNKGDDAPATPPVAADPVRLAWRQVDARTRALDLTRPCASLLGLRVAVTLPGGVTLEPGELLAGRDAPYFLRNGARGGLDAGLALLGAGPGIDRPGELLRVLLPEGIAPDAFATTVVEARDGANRPLPATVNGIDAGAGVAPAATRLLGNAPNPFNPVTTVRFALAAPGRARVGVYSLDGRLVRLLVDALLPAGERAVVWDGRDDRGRAVASGAYLCRLEAPGAIDSRKMILTK